MSGRQDGRTVIETAYAEFRNHKQMKD